MDLKKQGSNFTSLVKFGILLFDFSPAKFFDRIYIKLMIESSHSQLCKKYSCSVKLQFGPFGHSPGEMYVEDFSINKSVTFHF